MLEYLSSENIRRTSLSGKNNARLAKAFFLEEKKKTHTFALKKCETPTGYADSGYFMSTRIGQANVVTRILKVFFEMIK